MILFGIAFILLFWVMWFWRRAKKGNHLDRKDWFEIVATIVFIVFAVLTYFNVTPTLLAPYTGYIVLILIFGAVTTTALLINKQRKKGQSFFLFTSKELRLEDFLAKAKSEICISGFSSETLPLHKPSLIKKLIEQGGIHITFLLLNPKSELVTRVDQAFGSCTMENTIQLSLTELRNIKKSLLPEKQKKLEIKMYDLLPFYTMIVIDPNSDNGEMQVGCLLYKTDSMSRPLFTISKAKDKQNFEKYWDSYCHTLDNAVEIPSSV